MLCLGASSSVHLTVLQPSVGLVSGVSINKVCCCHNCVSAPIGGEERGGASPVGCHALPRAAIHGHIPTHPPLNPPLLPVQYNEMRSENGGNSPLLTAEQQHWVSLQQLLSATTIEVRGCTGLPCCGSCSPRYHV